MRLDELHPGQSFRIKHSGKEGELLHLSPSGATVKLVIPQERSFITAEGKQVTIRKRHKTMTLTGALQVEVLA